MRPTKRILVELRWHKWYLHYNYAPNSNSGNFEPQTTAWKETVCLIERRKERLSFSLSIRHAVVCGSKFPKSDAIQYSREKRQSKKCLQPVLGKTIVKCAISLCGLPPSRICPNSVDEFYSRPVIKYRPHSRLRYCIGYTNKKLTERVQPGKKPRRLAKAEKGGDTNNLVHDYFRW